MNPETHFLPNSNVEIIHEVPSGQSFQHVLFDFDGTLSLIREGWPDVMIPMMVQILQQTDTNETEGDLTQIVRNFVMELNGRQTIYQMMRLADEVTLRGGTPRDPLEYKHQYHDLLMERIEARRADLGSGKVAPEEMLVPGSVSLLESLQAKGVTLYLASGTDEKYVREELALLGLDGYFGARVGGAVDDYKSFSKAQVIQKILSDNQVDGTKLLGFGDGYVEIQNVKEVGGTAIAVASDEKNRSGKPDAWKRERLMGVGADVVIPDYRDRKQLLNYLWR